MGPTFFRYSILPSISLQVTQLGFIQAILMSGRQHKKLNLLTVGPSLAVSLEPLAHRRIVASLSLFCKYYFCRCSSELAELVLLPYFQGDLLVILIDWMIFPSSFLDVIRMCVNNFLAQPDSGILCV